MGEAEAFLLRAAMVYAGTGQTALLLSAAEELAQAKKRARNARDRWKVKKRLTSDGK